MESNVSQFNNKKKSTFIKLPILEPQGKAMPFLSLRIFLSFLYKKLFAIYPVHSAHFWSQIVMTRSYLVLNSYIYRIFNLFPRLFHKIIPYRLILLKLLLRLMTHSMLQWYILIFIWIKIFKQQEKKLYCLWHRI